MEDRAWETQGILFQQTGDGIGNGFTFSVIVGRQINRGGFGGGLKNRSSGPRLFFQKTETGLKVSSDSNGIQVFFKGTDMTHGR